jgi:hypothetical protein
LIIGGTFQEVGAEAIAFFRRKYSGHDNVFNSIARSAGIILPLMSRIIGTGS